MPGQRLLTVPEKVERLIKFYLALTGEKQATRAADPCQGRLDQRRLQLLWRVAFEAEQDRNVGAVAAAGERERAVQLHADLVGAREQSALDQVEYETAGGVHRPHRVRA